MALAWESVRCVIGFCCIELFVVVLAWESVRCVIGFCCIELSVVALAGGYLIIPVSPVKGNSYIFLTKCEILKFIMYFCCVICIRL